MLAEILQQIFLRCAVFREYDGFLAEFLHKLDSLLGLRIRLDAANFLDQLPNFRPNRRVLGCLLEQVDKR
ncbi:hypothetical protein D3C72_2503230 [compost metagenome]